ncbi:MAG TPA: polysaccharide deacetylase family protein [Symbiobacteriaceae bacterium]|nr:polysaccharide deacetylase family protein [Symbiobacteriaceae bacterium]
MERLARVHFRVIRINRWSLALAVVILLALLLLPSGGLMPTLAGSAHVVQQGVTISTRDGTRDFSGKTEQEARAMLLEMEAGFTAPPVDAQEAHLANGTSYVIPELNGYALDVDATWTRLAAAPANTRLEPATRVHTPTRRLSDYPQSVIRQGNPDKQAVGILINVDWGKEYLPSMLATLKKRGAHATFFVSGRWAKDNPTLVKMMFDNGHEIASHGYDLSQGPSALARAGKLKADIAKSTETIQAITGAPVKYYAPHMSEVDPTILKTAADLKLRTVLYSLDTIDWQDPAPETIVARVKNAMAGDLILMHPKANTAKALDTVLVGFQGKGLTPLTLSEMLSPEPSSATTAWMTRDNH